MVQDFERFAKIVARYRGGRARFGTGFAELPSARTQPSWLPCKLAGECLLLGGEGARAWLEQSPLSRGAWAAHVFGRSAPEEARFSRKWTNSILEAPSIRGELPAGITLVRGKSAREALARELGAGNTPEGSDEVLVLSGGSPEWGAASLTLEEGVAYLADLFVKPAHRGRGLGSKLIKAALRIAWREGCSRVWALPSERGRALYGLMGFVARAPLSTYLTRE